MADFVSGFWSMYVTVITVVGILACAVLLFFNLKQPSGPVQTMGHTWDETLAEYNNPLPAWWVWLFVITMVFGGIYLTLYPGLGSNKGVLGWSSHESQYKAEMDQAAAKYDPIFAKFAALEIEKVAADPQAHAMGERLFLTYCSQCHGSDARGGKGFPNLTDDDWLHGGSPAKIEETILKGRIAAMPPMGEALGSADDVNNVVNYVKSLSGGAHDGGKAALGKEKFALCAACHGPDGKGNQEIGSANLTDKIWLWGGSDATITETIVKGRTNQMPSFEEFLGPAKVHLLAAYVWSLSNKPGAPATASLQ